MQTAEFAIGENVRCSLRRTFVWLTLLAVTTLALYHWVDVPLVRIIRHYKEASPAYLDSIFDAARYYGQAFSVALAFLLMLRMDPRHRRDAFLLAIAVFTATIAVSLIKTATSRARPHEFLAHGRMWHAFAGFASAKYCSFPSGHATTAFAFSAALSRTYPKGRTIFFVAAALCAVSRVLDLQHYPSDVITGAVLGGWIGYGAYRWQWSAKLAEGLADAFPFMEKQGTLQPDAPAEENTPKAVQPPNADRSESYPASSGSTRTDAFAAVPTREFSDTSP
ncbi:MAG: phosphatase PAP2 family protein [Planctomycetes bacterium]|nr:phosphatase PAP2 family protein [Planctomycetota bacterium]